MTALLYLFVGVLSVTLSGRTWLSDRKNPRHTAFLAFGLCLGIAYLSFSLSLLPGLQRLRLLYMTAGMCLPVITLWSLDQLFSDEPGQVSPEVRRLTWVTIFVVPTLLILHVGVFMGTGPWVLTDLLAGLFAFVSFLFPLRRIHEQWQRAPLNSDKFRLQILLGVTSSAIGLTVVEQLGRTLGPTVDLLQLHSIPNRVLALHGPIPPLSTLFSALAVYAMYQVLVMSRLLDLQELLTRIANLAFFGFLLVLIDGFTLIWVGTFTDYPVHSTFQIFVASVLFLALYDPLRDQVEWWTNRTFNPRGQHLNDAIEELRSELPSVVSSEELTDLLLSRLHSSGRVPVCSLYLWDRSLDAFSLVRTLGEPLQPPLVAVAPHPFSEIFNSQERWLVAADLLVRARRSDKWDEILSLQVAMNAELTIPLFSRNRIVLGWLNLQDESWSDGFSMDEVLQLNHIARVAATVLANIEEFKAIEEEHRLAALGAMAAGLAHEIRNPLAGIHGAAQYLQSEDLSETSSDMIGIIIDETQRLNVAVSSFLDYARPYKLTLQVEHLNTVCVHVLAVIRAEGLPPGITLKEDLSGQLPALEIDANKIAQVVLNLVQNAIQAMPDGGVLRLSTRLRPNRAGVPCAECVISDTGVGISLADQEKLFVPFFTTKERGTGLGLALSQRIIQEHDGEIDLSSNPGQGSTFVIRLPLPRD